MTPMNMNALCKILSRNLSIFYPMYFRLTHTKVKNITLSSTSYRYIDIVKPIVEVSQTAVYDSKHPKYGIRTGAEV